MPYDFCPRCKFKVIAAKKHICSTCGYKLPRTGCTADNTDSDSSDSHLERQIAMPRLWSKLFRWEFDSVDAESIESTQEKPALG
jgi:hypothetical protein